MLSRAVCNREILPLDSAKDGFFKEEPLQFTAIANNTTMMPHGRKTLKLVVFIEVASCDQAPVLSGDYRCSSAHFERLIPSDCWQL